MVSVIKNKKNKSILGISIIEALVSTVIVGIGFVAILQMVNYSVQFIPLEKEQKQISLQT